MPLILRPEKPEKSKRGAGVMIFRQRLPNKGTGVIVLKLEITVSEGFEKLQAMQIVDCGTQISEPWIFCRVGGAWQGFQCKHS